VTVEIPLPVHAFAPVGPDDGWKATVAATGMPTNAPEVTVPANCAGPGPESSVPARYETVLLLQVSLAVRALFPASQLPSPVAVPETLPEVMLELDPWQFVSLPEKVTLPDLGVTVRYG